MLRLKRLALHSVQIQSEGFLPPSSITPNIFHAKFIQTKLPSLSMDHRILKAETWVHGTYLFTQSAGYVSHLISSQFQRWPCPKCVRTRRMMRKNYGHQACMSPNGWIQGFEVSNSSYRTAGRFNDHLKNKDPEFQMTHASSQSWNSPDIPSFHLTSLPTRVIGTQSSKLWTPQ